VWIESSGGLSWTR